VTAEVTLTVHFLRCIGEGGNADEISALSP